jgi:hypothetical protein
MLGNAASGILASYTSVKFSIISGGVLTVIGTIILALLLPKFIRYHSSEGLKRKEKEESERNSRITNQALVDEDRKFSEDSY